ncbi:MAG: prepilin-type N-terminal cleavage/methylation domain-containing protein [Magnetococcales bacterium]|nr:prepilin-type N-terminal cleavage/methylation domain-containing protein [Magnetococcales bacterium]
MRTRHGFTLIEMVITMVILGLLLGGSTHLITNVMRAWTLGQELIPMTSQGGLAMERMVREIRRGRWSTVSQPSGTGSLQFTNDQGQVMRIDQTGAPADAIYLNGQLLAPGVQVNSLEFTLLADQVVGIALIMSRTDTGRTGQVELEVPLRSAVHVRNN